MKVIVETRRRTYKNAEASHVCLSRRDIQLAYLATEGHLNKDISYLLGITEGTVKVYMSNLYAKLGLSNRAELAAWTIRNEHLLGNSPLAPELLAVPSSPVCSN